MKMNNHKKNCLSLIFLSAAISACTTDMSDLHTYVESTKSKFHGSVEPLPQFEPYKVYSYRSDRNPFQPLDEIEADIRSQESNINSPVNRPLEPLEYFPLDSLSMVGTLDRGGIRWGLVKDTDQKIHRVKTGNHIGQDYGTINKITSSSISITELVQDSAGLWTERVSQLHIGD